MPAAIPTLERKAERSMGMNANAASRINTRITAFGDSRFLRGGTSSMGRGHSKSYRSFKGCRDLTGEAADHLFCFRFHHHARQ